MVSGPPQHAVVGVWHGVGLSLLHLAGASSLYLRILGRWRSGGCGTAFEVWMRVSTGVVAPLQWSWRDANGMEQETGSGNEVALSLEGKAWCAGRVSGSGAGESRAGRSSFSRRRRYGHVYAQWRGFVRKTLYP